MKIAYDLEQVEKLMLPQLEERLRKAVESKDYVKLLFEQPNITSHLAVKFLHKTLSTGCRKKV